MFVFYTLASVHDNIIVGVELLPPHRSWYVLPDILYGIQSTATLFQLELERLMRWEAPHGIVLLGKAGVNVPSLRNFLEILSKLGP